MTEINDVVQLYNVPYPNPATESFNIELAETSTLAFSNTKGQSLFLGSGNGKINIPVADLSTGIYFLSISNKKGITRHKVLVQNRE